jgi:hypothetical protein
MGNQVVILDLPYKLDLSSYEYPMTASFGTIFDLFATATAKVPRDRPSDGGANRPDATAKH